MIEESEERLSEEDVENILQIVANLQGKNKQDTEDT